MWMTRFATLLEKRGPKMAFGNSGSNSGIHVLGKAFQRDLARVGRAFFRFIDGFLGQGSLENVKGIVATAFTFAAIDGSVKFERYAVHGLGGKSELVAVEFAGFKEVIEKNSAIAFGIAVTGDETGDVSLGFDRDLHEFAIFQETVHTGVFGAMYGSLGGGLCLNFGL